MRNRVRTLLTVFGLELWLLFVLAIMAGFSTLGIFVLNWLYYGSNA